MTGKRWIMGVLAMALALSVFVGCSGANNAAENGADAPSPDGAAATQSPENAAKLVFWNFKTDPVWEASANAVAEELNIDLDYEYIQDETYKTKMKVAVAGNELPDAFAQHAGDSYRSLLLDSKSVAPLNDVLDSTGLAPAFNSGQLIPDAEGNIYSVPMESSTVLVAFYNKKLVKELGLQAPQTWDDLMNIVKAANEKGLVPIALGGKEAWQGDMIYNMLVLREDKDAFTKAMKGEMKFTDEPFVTAARRLSELVEANAFQKGFLSTSYYDSVEMLKGGKAVMSFDGSWAFADLIPALKDDLGYVIFPKTGAEDVYSSTIGTGGPAPYGLFVNARSKELSKAKEFIVRLSLRVNDEYVKQGLPGYAKSEATPPADVNQEMLKFAEDIKQIKAVQPLWFAIVSASTGSEFRDVLQQLYAAQLTPESFADKMEQVMRKN